MNKENKTVELVFIHSCFEYKEGFYCDKCFYNDMKLKREKYELPNDHECFGRVGYYMEAA